MSLVQRPPACKSWGFPRVSGDEPGPEDLDKVLLVFSPRERG